MRRWGVVQPWVSTVWDLWALLSMAIMFFRPVLHGGRIDVFDQDMDMLQRPYALQSHPVLEPHYALFASWPKLVDEERLDKVLNEPPALRRHITSSELCWDERTAPHDNMGDVRSQTIWPVVAEDTIVGRIGEGDLRYRGKRKAAPGTGQTVVHEIVGHATVLGLCLCRPHHVPAQV